MGTWYNNDYGQYKTVAASQTTAQISREGSGNGDVLHTLTVFAPSSTPGAITLFDGSNTIGTIPAGAGDGTKPYTLLLDITSNTSKGFNITTGASVSVLAVGRF